MAGLRSSTALALLTAAAAALALSACSSSTHGKGTTSGTPSRESGPASPPASSQSSTSAPKSLYAACTAAQQKQVPSALGMKSCWALPETSLGTAGDGVLVDGQLWSLDGTRLTVSDASTGALVTRATLPGEPQGMSAVMVNGKPEVLVVGYQHTAATGTTKAGTTWIADGYAAPAQAAASATPVYKVPGSVATTSDYSTNDISFGADSVITGDALLHYGDDQFEKFTEAKLDLKGGTLGDGVDYASLGTAGDLLIAPVNDAAFVHGTDFKNLLGYAAVRANGTVDWDATKIIGGNPSSAGYDGPSLTSAIIGDYIASFSTPGDSGPAASIAWYDTMNGQVAHPTPTDLAGRLVVQDGAGSDGNNGTIVMSADGKYLMATDSVSGGAVVADVAAGTVKHLDTGQVLTAVTADGDTAYAVSDGGAATVDLPTVKATALPQGVVAPEQLTGQAALLDEAIGGDAVTVLVGR